jgi:hypothetical protein
MCEVCIVTLNIMVMWNVIVASYLGATWLKMLA